jgi:hypothetical protein
MWLVRRLLGSHTSGRGRGARQRSVGYPVAVVRGLEEPMIYAYERRLLLALGLSAVALFLNGLLIVCGCARMVYGVLLFWR